MSVSHHPHHDHAHDHHAHDHHHTHHDGHAPLLWRIGVIIAALVAIIAVGSLIGLFIGSPAPTPAPKSPFGMGLREGGAATSGLAAWILDVQSQFARAMNAAVRAFKSDAYAGLTLIGVAFAYGVFHAAGPGHGKAIIAAYAVATEKQIKGGIVLSLGAALLQAAVAIIIVGVFAILFGATAKVMAQAANWIELASFALVALVGGWLLWVKAGALAAVLQGGTHNHHHHHHHHHDHEHNESCGCGHDHAPLPPALATWKSMAATILAAGIRPCSGAIVVLVFALSQGVFWLGVLATFGMAIGTFLTTATLAIFTILAKSKARALAGGEESRRGQIVASGFETLAAAAVLCLGVVLMAGTIS
ncbi:MAG: nickel/cobalt transporter [Beijerinckiaceae bacterium]|nr:nickel/cobalt transporter [Beijerinckiaceae bacterium]